MKNRLKKILPLSLLALTLMPMIFSASFLIRLKIIQHEAKEKLEKGMLQAVVLDKNDFYWFKKNKEISIHGKLFDVKSFFVKDNKFVFTGIFDEDETALNNKLDNGYSKRKNQYLIAVFQLLYSASPPHWPELAGIARVSKNICPLTIQHFSSPYKDVLTPPPQLV